MMNRLLKRPAAGGFALALICTLSVPALLDGQEAPRVQSGPADPATPLVDGGIIVSIALAEIGRGPQEVGRDMDSLPTLGRFLRPGEAWCSEFVSWSYQAAGSPFDGGDSGGMMLRSSTQIKNWFKARGRFVSRSSPEWVTFVPRPGDYIRYDNYSGGHSGIVRSVAGDTLYTVEGNIENQVVLRVIENWREKSDIDGFGLR